MAFEIRSRWSEIKLPAPLAEFLHQEFFGLAQIEKVLDGPAIFFCEIGAMGAVKRFSLLKRSDLIIGDKELEVAAVMISKDEHLVAGWLCLTFFDGFESRGVDSRRPRHIVQGRHDLSPVF